MCLYGDMSASYRNAALQGVTHDIHADVVHDEGIMEMHNDAEKFDPRTEQVIDVHNITHAQHLGVADDWSTAKTLSVDCLIVLSCFA